VVIIFAFLDLGKNISFSDSLLVNDNNVITNKIQHNEIKERKNNYG